VGSFSFEVAGEPVSQNRAYKIVTRNGKQGGHHGSLKMSGEAYIFKTQIAVSAARACPVQRIQDPISVVIELWFGSARPDIDGPVKLALDALQGMRPPKKAINRSRMFGCIKNDRQVIELHVRRRIDPARPRMKITLNWPATEASP
jgi:Holliday junction resolvase RusA-like endonuclease